MKKPDKTFVLYAVIGLSGVLLDTLLFFALYNLGHVDKTLATFISISLAVVNNFLLNVFLNFKVKDRLLQRFGKFYLVGLTGIALTAALFFLFVDIAKFDANIVKLGSLVPVLLLQYSLNKYWSFKTEGAHDAAKTE